MLDDLIKLAEEVFKKDKEMGKRMGDMLITLHAKLVEQHRLMAMMNKDLHDMLAHIEQLEGKKKVQ
jgi:hypothetical protein